MVPEGQSLALLSLHLSSSWHLEKVRIFRVALPGDGPSHHNAGLSLAASPALGLWTVPASLWSLCRGRWEMLGLSRCSQPSSHQPSLLCLDPALPVPLAGALVLPPVQSQAAGHAWLSLDTHCHLHYEVLLAGLGGSEQGTITAHLLGPPGMPGPRRLLKGFYGPEVRRCWWEAVWKIAAF